MSRPEILLIVIHQRQMNIMNGWMLSPKTVNFGVATPNALIG